MTGNGRTFVSDAQPYPRRRNDWERLATVAADLRDQHAAQAAKLVTDGRMTQAGAAERSRRLAGVAELWRRVIGMEKLPHIADCDEALGTSYEAMLAEMRKYADFAVERAAGDAAAADRAEYLAALWWHLRPVAPGALPHIWIAADFARWQHQRGAQSARAA